MPAVFVHGNLESTAIWRPLIDALDRDDCVCLSPPGFGSPLPPHFGATWIEYRDWLIDELAAIGEPVDLVGHDWGGGHVVNVALVRPDLLRSWTSDVLGVYDEEHVWHDWAQVWRTLGAGEQMVEGMFGGTVEDRAAQNSALGIPDVVVRELAEAQDSEMARSMLGLYRSAPESALRELGRSLPSARSVPSLAVVATDDTLLGTREMHLRAAERAGARIATMSGRNHWWMLQDPEGSARTLTEFWARVPVAEVATSQ